MERASICQSSYRFYHPSHEGQCRKRKLFPLTTKVFANFVITISEAVITHPFAKANSGPFPGPPPQFRLSARQESRVPGQFQPEIIVIILAIVIAQAKAHLVTQHIVATDLPFRQAAIALVIFPPCGIKAKPVP